MIKNLMTYIFILIISVHLFAKEWNWKLFDKMKIPVAGAEIVTWEDKIYILGGYREADGAPVSTIQMYDPSKCIQKRWSIVGDMLIPRANFVAKLYDKDNCIYIAGGTTNFNQENVPTMEKWDLAANKGSILLEDISLNRTSATAEIWRDYLIILGGYNNARPNDNLGYVAVYDLSTRETLPPIPSFSNQEPYDQASITTGDSIYIFGGIRSGISDRIYNFNLAALINGWPPPGIGDIMPRVHPDLDFPRSAMEAVNVSPDTVWLIGGYSSGDSTALHTTSKFVIKREKNNKGYEHHHAPPLRQARKEHVAAELNDIIYVFGGFGKDGKVVDTIEAFIDTVLVDSCKDTTDTTKVQVSRHQNLSFVLRQNYPNPFNHSTLIEFELPVNESVRLDIYTSQGRLVATLIDQPLPFGAHRVLWDGRSIDGELLPSGVYLYKLITEHKTETRKMLLVK